MSSSTYNKYPRANLSAASSLIASKNNLTDAWNVGGGATPSLSPIQSVTKYTFSNDTANPVYRASLSGVTSLTVGMAASGNLTDMWCAGGGNWTGTGPGYVSVQTLRVSYASDTSVAVKGSLPTYRIHAAAL